MSIIVFYKFLQKSKADLEISKSILQGKPNKVNKKEESF